MAQLAIKGHLTRGKEVIEILEMLGGKNLYNYRADLDNLCYYIGKETKIIYHDYVKRCYKDEGTFVFFTLEEFLEKFPYKVGDKVIYHENAEEIIAMRWDVADVVYTVNCNDGVWDASVFNLQPYKEENMKEKLEQITLDIPKGYEFFGINDDNQVVLAKKQLQYPKTFIEVLNFWHPDRQIEDDYQRCYKKDLIEKFQDLLYARGAYWKIAGEEMGLGKPWEPDWKNYDVRKYCIATDKNIVGKYNRMTGNKILAFPTEEMRDAFYNNFKELIEECKELL